MRWIATFIQVCALYALSSFGNLIVNLLHWPVPGSLIGLFILFGLLQLNIVKVRWIDLGAAWLIGELLLFFVPSAVGVVQYGQLVKTAGPRVLLVIACSTFLVMTVTGLMAHTMSRGRQTQEERGEI